MSNEDSLIAGEDRGKDLDERYSLVHVVHRSLDSTRRDRIRAFFPSGILLLIVIGAFLVSDLADEAALMFGVVGVFLLGTALTGILCNPSGSIRRGTEPAVAIDDAGLTISTVTGFRRRLPFEVLALAWFFPLRTVELYVYNGSTYSLSFRNKEDARSLVAQVRSRQARRAYELSLDGPIHTVVGGTQLGLAVLLSSLLSLSVLGPLGLIPGLIPPLIFLLLGLRVLFIRRHVRFGADGFFLSRGARERFVPFKEVEQVRPSLGDGFIAPLYLRLRGGGWLRVPGVRGRGHTAMLAALIGEGVGMHQQGVAAGAAVADLERHEESPVEWYHRLGGLVRGRYRDVTLSPQKLATLMRNPATDPAQRVAAAVALLREPGAQSRIRVAAEVSADPKVRAVFEELAQAKEDELDDETLATRAARLSSAVR